MRPGEFGSRLTYLSVFCDTDGTGSSSEAVFATVRMTRRNSNEGP